MTQEFYFKNAKWVGAKERTPKTFSVLRGKFELKEFNKVNLNILGLGFFKCYINGKCINPDTFLPLSSDFEAGCVHRYGCQHRHHCYRTDHSSGFHRVRRQLPAVAV